MRALLPILLCACFVGPQKTVDVDGKQFTGVSEATFDRIAKIRANPRSDGGDDADAAKESAEEHRDAAYEIRDAIEEADSGNRDVAINRLADADVLLDQGLESGAIIENSVGHAIIVGHLDEAQALLLAGEFAYQEGKRLDGEAEDAYDIGVEHQDAGDYAEAVIVFVLAEGYWDQAGGVPPDEITPEAAWSLAMVEFNRSYLASVEAIYYLGVYWHEPEEED